jgi:hypothetical protein
VEHAKWRRETRRDAYADFLTSVERLRDTIGPLAQAFPGPPYTCTADDIATLEGLRELFQARYDDAYSRGRIVQLEGPGEVASAAHDV